MLVRRARVPALTIALLLLVAACNGNGNGDGEEATDAAEGTGPISIWYSNNEAEIEWGEGMVEAWNEENPDEEVTAQEIPAGESSEEVITASIAAGNTPCLIYNTAPVGVPDFQRQGGLVDLSELPDGEEYVEERVGDDLEQYRSEDGGLYQMPWKANPVMIFYNRSLFEEAGLDPDDPPLATYDEFLETAEALVENTDVIAAIWPSPSAEFYEAWFDFYPLFAAQTGGQLLVEDGEAQFNGEEGVTVGEFWRELYERGLASPETYEGDAFAEEVSAMAIVGPWAIDVYDDVDWDVVPVPTEDGTPVEEIYTFSDTTSVGLYVTCENTETAWEFLQYTTSEDADRDLLETTGQMPIRTDLTEVYPEYFEENPQYELFADQTSRMVEVPSVPSSIEVWQEFRSAYSQAVIFREGEVQAAFDEAADRINNLIQE